MRDCKKVFWSAKDFCNAKGLVSLCLEIGMVNIPQAWTLAAAGDNFWYGKKHGVYIGSPMNKVPSVVSTGKFLNNFGHVVNVGGTAFGIGLSIYDYHNNPNYGDGFSGKDNEFGFDLGFSTIGAFRAAGSIVSGAYFIRIKPVLKAESTGNVDDRYNATFSPYDGALRGIRDATKRQEDIQELKNNLIKFFND